jgi:hypothetical protein
MSVVELKPGGALLADLGKPTMRGIRKCPKCSTFNGTRCGRAAESTRLEKFFVRVRTELLRSAYDFFFSPFWKRKCILLDLKAYLIGCSGSFPSNS